MKNWKRVALAAIMSAIPCVSWAAGEMRDGLWEIATTMEMPGMPYKVPPQVVKHCYTKEDVKDQKKVVNTNKDCTVTDMKVSGNKVSYAMKCTGKNPSTMTGETVYSGDSYTSTMKMKNQGKTMDMKIKARRVGNCP